VEVIKAVLSEDVVDHYFADLNLFDRFDIVDLSCRIFTIDRVIRYTSAKAFPIICVVTVFSGLSKSTM
jgi:hypothetical protein